jgi:long-subunit acyl-CoA synthetase (AMP-forming)
MKERFLPALAATLLSLIAVARIYVMIQEGIEAKAPTHDLIMYVVLTSVFTIFLWILAYYLARDAAKALGGS